MIIYFIKISKVKHNNNQTLNNCNGQEYTNITTNDKWVNKKYAAALIANTLNLILIHDLFFELSPLD